MALPRTLQTGGSGTSSSSGSGAGAGDEAGVRAEGPAAAGAGAGAGAAEVDAARTVGVPRLAKIAEAAVRRQLKEDIEHAERVRGREGRTGGGMWRVSGECRRAGRGDAGHGVGRGWAVVERVGRVGGAGRWRGDVDGGRKRGLGLCVF